MNFIFKGGAYKAAFFVSSYLTFWFYLPVRFVVWAMSYETTRQQHRARIVGSAFIFSWIVAATAFTGIFAGVVQALVVLAVGLFFVPPMVMIDRRLSARLNGFSIIPHRHRRRRTAF